MLRTTFQEQSIGSKTSLPVKSKKVYSKPLEPSQSMLMSAATDYVPNANDISEEARKKLRVDRLRQATIK